MTKEEIDQVKNWTSDEARQYFIDQEKEIERLIAGRTKSEEEKDKYFKKIQPLVDRNLELAVQLKSLRNSTIDSCLKACEFLNDDGRLYMEDITRRLNALKTPD